VTAHGGDDDHDHDGSDDDYSVVEVSDYVYEFHNFTPLTRDV